MKSLIQNSLHYDRFLQFIPDLQRDEVYFLSLSARNKYLSDEEQKRYDLGRTEMFSRHIAFDKDGISLALDRMKADLSVRKTRNGSHIPDKCLVVYFNVHPSSTVKAYRRFSEQMDRHYEEAFLGTLNGSKASDMWIPFHQMRTTLMNHIQKSFSRKLMVDIDIDGEDDEQSKDLMWELHSFLTYAECHFMTIQTQGGYHILIPTKYLGKHVPLHKKLNELDNRTQGEVKFNSNAMVPLPGTLQAEKLVKVL